MSRSSRYLYGILSRRSDIREKLREISLEDWLALAASEF